MQHIFICPSNVLYVSFPYGRFLSPTLCHNRFVFLSLSISPLYTSAQSTSFVSFHELSYPLSRPAMFATTAVLVSTSSPIYFALASYACSSL